MLIRGDTFEVDSRGLMFGENKISWYCGNTLPLKSRALTWGNWLLVLPPSKTTKIVNNNKTKRKLSCWHRPLMAITPSHLLWIILVVVPLLLVDDLLLLLPLADDLLLLLEQALPFARLALNAPHDTFPFTLPGSKYLVSSGNFTFASQTLCWGQNGNFSSLRLLFASIAIDISWSATHSSPSHCCRHWRKLREYLLSRSLISREWQPTITATRFRRSIYIFPGCADGPLASPRPLRLASLAAGGAHTPSTS